MAANAAIARGRLGDRVARMVRINQYAAVCRIGRAASGSWFGQREANACASRSGSRLGARAHTSS